MTAPEEIVEFNILLEAQKALITLSDLTNATTSYSKQVEIANIKTKEFANDAGISFQKAKSMLQGLDAELSVTTETSVVFGERGQQAWNKVGQSAESNSKLMVGGVDIVRRAVSFLIGQLLFQLLAAFQQVFTSAIDNVKKLETSFYNLANAEKAMSENGVVVTFKDLEAVVDRLHTKFQGLFSANELQSVVAQIAIATKNLGLTTDQIEKIAQTAATIQLRNPDKTISEIAQTLTTADLNGRLVSLAKLGVNTTEIKNKEAELAAQLGTTTDKLTENQKATIELEAAYQAVNGETDNLIGRQNTIQGAQQRLNATWDDFITKIGVIAAPILIKFFQSLADELQKASLWVEKNKTALTALSNVIAAGIPTGIKLLEILVTVLSAVGLAVLRAVEGFQKLINLIPGLKQAMDKVSGNYESINAAPPDTPTSIGVSPSSTTENSQLIQAEQKTEDELNKIFQENRDKRIDIDTNYQQKLQDIALNNQQKLQDIALKEAQATQDAYTNYNQKIQDIQINAQQKIQDAQQEARQKEKELTQKHYETLRNLRDKYLMDLEEALHNRDARQILRIMQQYQHDKKAENTSYEQQQQQIQEQTKLKIQQIQNDEKLQEEAAKRDLDRKLADIQLTAARERQQQAIANQRALNDAAIAYQRQLQEQQIYLQRKLRDLATAIQQEYNLTAAGMAAIDALMSSYATGASTGTTGSSTGTAPSNTNTSTSSIGSPIGNPNAPSSVNGGLYTPGGLAEGGTFLATRPTRINVAENRPEIITATPLGKPGQDVGKIFAQSGIGGGGGQIEILMTLSPDLEARVVRKSLDATANIVTKINRSR